jgi:hypothetical protein
VTRKHKTKQACEPMEIALRAYVPSKQPHPFNGGARTDQGPSEYSLIFDTETTIDSSQRLRFGGYQVRRHAELFEAGIFYDPQALNTEEIELLRDYADTHGLKLIPAEEFIDRVLYGIAYSLRGTIVGFNLPFDLSRLAIRHGNARGRLMGGGFTLKLSSQKIWPNIQIKHLSNRAAFIQFTTRPGRFDTRGMRKRQQKALPRRGYFLDIKTLAAALTSRSFKLESLADFLNTPTRKLDTEEHGGQLSEAYIGYALQDVQVTWECYQELLVKFALHNFTKTLPTQILSEASVGKAYLKEMNIRSWREVQPEFSDEMIGNILSAYYGGRSENHARREVTQVAYCDFLSMYPTICTLMGLWKFIISNGISYQNNTKEIRRLINEINLADMQKKSFWPKLTTLVQIMPDDHVLPVRAPYGGETQLTIGFNHLKSNKPLWFTLADVIASKLISGKTPRILKAITFESKGIQDSLNSIDIAGNSEYRINPSKDDFFRLLIELRNEIKERLKHVTGADRAILEAAQLALKIIANSTSYGIFIELNVEDLKSPEKRLCYGFSGKPFKISTSKAESPGRYFHPLLATLITGGARLMLAVTQTLAQKNGLDWAFCDTDSMAIAKTNGVEATFNDRVEIIRKYFEPLNPYSGNSSLLKLEEANFETGDNSGKLVPLYFFGISSKRYVLFNLGDTGEIFIRKASAHGLGHLMAPYFENEPPNSIPAPLVPLNEIGVERWQYDLWHQIIRATLDGHPDQVDLNYHPALNMPAASRYAATKPGLLDWFKKHNLNRAYSRQVRPFNFLCAFHARLKALQFGTDPKSNSEFVEQPKPVAPFDKDIATAAQNCFDRETGNIVDVKWLKTYSEVLAQYHLRPESKFLNGDYLDRGMTERRHIQVISIRHIGKEADRWEEQFYLGADEGAEIDYGSNLEDAATLVRSLRKTAKVLGQRALAQKSRIPQQSLSRWLRLKPSKMSARIMRLIVLGLFELNRNQPK